MTIVELTVPLLIDQGNYPAGTLVTVTDQRGADLIASGHARLPEADLAQTLSRNSGVANMLADYINPAPAEGMVLNPADGLLPSIADNAGLAKLALYASQALHARRLLVVQRSSEGFELCPTPSKIEVGG